METPNAHLNTGQGSSGVATTGETFVKQACFVGQYGGIVSTIAALITDFLTPKLGIFNSILAGLLVIAFMACILVHLLGGAKVNDLFSKLMKGHWCMPVLCALVLAFLIFATAGYLAEQSPESKEKGVVASNIKVVAQLQKQFGLLQQMDKRLANIEEYSKQSADSNKQTSANTKQTAESARSIDTKIDNLKKETSDDPKKELANRGLPATWPGFQNCFDTYDVENIELYYRGSFNPNHEYSVHKIGWLLRYENAEHRVEIFKVALDYGLKPDNIAEDLLEALEKRVDGWEDLLSLAVKHELSMNKEIARFWFPPYTFAGELKKDKYTFAEYPCLDNHFDEDLIYVFIKYGADYEKLLHDLMKIKKTFTEKKKKYSVDIRSMSDGALHDYINRIGMLDEINAKKLELMLLKNSDKEINKYILEKFIPKIIKEEIDRIEKNEERCNRLITILQKN